MKNLLDYIIIYLNEKIYAVHILIVTVAHTINILLLYFFPGPTAFLYKKGD